MLIRGPFGEEAGWVVLMAAVFGFLSCHTDRGHSQEMAQSWQTLGSIQCVLVSLTAGLNRAHVHLTDDHVIAMLPDLHTSGVHAARKMI